MFTEDLIALRRLSLEQRVYCGCSWLWVWPLEQESRASWLMGLFIKAEGDGAIIQHSGTDAASDNTKQKKNG